jgi:hypothetical protein
VLPAAYVKEQTMARGTIWLVLLIALPGRAWPGTRDFTITDHLRHHWKDEVVRFSVEFAPGECDGKNIALVQAWDGRRVPCQLTEATRHAEGSVRQARLTFLAEVPARQSRTWRFEWGRRGPQPPSDPPLTAARDGEALVLSSGAIAVRAPYGQRRFSPPMHAAQAPGPLLGVEGPDRQRRGQGWLESPLAVEGYETTLLEDGPVLKAARVDYRFAGGKTYRFTVRVYQGLNYAHVVEEADVDKASKFVFSAHAGFSPTHSIRPYQAPEPLRYQEDRRLIRFFFNTYIHQVFDFKDWIGLYRNESSSKDFLAFVKVNGGDWTSPLHNTIHFLERKSPDLRLEAALRPCRREWLVAMFDRTKVPELTSNRQAPLSLLCARVGLVPLDEVKDMVLSWPIKERPAARQPDDRRTAEKLLERWGGKAHTALTDGVYDGDGPLMFGYSKDSARDYGRVAGTGVLSADDERFVRAAMAFLAYVGMNRDYFAWYFPLLPREDTSDAEEPLQNWRYNFYMMNTNFDANRFTGIGEMALSLREHPDFDKFLNHYKQCLRLHLDNTFSEDGYYHEDISYKVYDLFRLAETMHRMKREIGLDTFDEPRFKKGLWCLIKMLTPPDPRYGGARTLPPFGDHDPFLGVQYGWGDMLLGRMAETYAERDPELAGALAWAWSQSGIKAPAPKVAPKIPALRSETIRGWGAVLRSPGLGERESYLLFRCDPFVGRYVNIENGVHIYAKGRPLVVTPQGGGFEGNDPFGSLGRNKVNFNGTAVYEHWWGQLGELEEFHALGTCDYVRGFVQGDAYQRKEMNWSDSFRDKTHAHRRHVIRRGDCFVIADEVKCDYPSDFTLNVLADRGERQGDTVRFTGRFDVDMDAHFLLPPTSIETRKAAMIVGANYAKREPVLWLHAVAPANRPWLTVLAPWVRGKETPPQVQRLGETFGLRITQGTATDYVFLSPGAVEWKSEGVRFSGTRGVVRPGPRVELALLDAGFASAGKATLRSSAGGVALAACAEGGWEGQASGGPKVVHIDGAGMRQVHLDGKPLTWEATPEGVKFSLPEGRHSIRLR